MNKDELIVLLKEYKENKAKLIIKLKELKTKRIQLKACEEIETSLTSSYGVNQDIHSKNKISDKVLKRIEENDHKRQEFESEIKKLENIVKELRYKTETVEDRMKALKYKERKIFEAYYIEGRSYEEIGTQLYFELFKQTRNWETIKKITEKALNKIINL